jgi:hypothetical protein
MITNTVKSEKAESKRGFMNRALATVSFAILTVVASQSCLAATNDAASIETTDMVAALPAPFVAVKPAELPDQPKPNKTLWKGLAVLGQAAAAADVASTIDVLNHGGYEADPLAKPLAGLPKPMYAATSAAIVGGVSYLGLKMQESRRFHKVWWVPQVLQIAINSTGALHNSVSLAYTTCHQHKGLIRMANGQTAYQDANVCSVF